MSTAQIILSVIQLVCALFLIAVVLLQSGRRAGLGAIGGAAESFMSKSKAKSWDAKLSRITAIVGVIFLGLTIILFIPF